MIKNEKDNYSILKKKKKLKIIPLCIIVIACFVLVVYVMSEMYVWYQGNIKINRLNKKVKDIVDIKKNNADGELVEPENDKNSDYWYYVDLPFYEVDFDKLLENNKDTVAFIYMKNINIQYPVVRSTNNDFYQNHAFDGSSSDIGSIFMDYRNDANKLSDNTIIYGGDNDKSVFNSLKDTFTESWQKKKDNYAIWLSTPKYNMLFQIFSIYTAQNENFYMMPEFSSTDDKRNWLDITKDRSMVKINNSVNINNNILTLSTIQRDKDRSIIVQAKLIKRLKRSN